MKKFQVYLLMAWFAIFCLASGTAAQSVLGVISGTVTDPSGASVPNATITIRNIGTEATQTGTTSTDGSYRFSSVPPGQYTVDVMASSFAEFRASGIVVAASQVVALNVKLELARGKEVIEVTEQTPLVQTATSDLSVQIDRTTIDNAALPDRDIFTVLPFLAPTATRGLDGNPTVGGARESGTSYLLNGADNNDNFSEGAINVHPPLESVQDFSILTNDMGAQYGRSAGAVVTVNQKSGTNKIHGAVYEYNRNDALNANDFFTNRQGLPRPKYVRNQFGGEIDGPIRKDKSFYSFAYDRVKLIAGAAPAQTYVPTSAGLAYLEANGGTIAKAILAARPPVTSDAPCAGKAKTGAGTNYWKGNGLPNPVGCLSFVDPESDTEDAYYGRVDHNFSANDRLSFSANIFRQSFVDKYGGGSLTTIGPIGAVTTNHWHNFDLNETHSFNPRLFNEFTLSQNRHFNLFLEGKGQADTLPEIIVDNATGGCLTYDLGGDYEGGQVEGFVQDRWGATDNLTWSVGRHTLKFGGGGQYGILYRNWDLGLPGYYEFGELTTLNAAGTAVVTPATDPNGSTVCAGGTICGIQDSTQSNFAGEYPYFQETSINPPTGAKADAYRHFTYHDYNLFVQDDWKVSTKLTLNLGLRWERYGAPTEANGRLSQFINLGCPILSPSCLSSLRMGPVSRMWPTRNKDFGPRFGFAWDPTGKGKMAVRGGYGILYDRIFDNIWSNGTWNPPFYALIDFDATKTDAINYSNPNSIGAGYNPNGPKGPIPYPGKRVSLRSMDQNMKDASSQNFYLGVERQVFGGMLLRASYQGALGRHLPMLENLNRYNGDAYGVSSPTSFTAVLPNKLYNGFNYRSNSVSSNYNALVLEAQKHMGHGLEFQTGYTYSKLLDVNSDLFAGCSTVGGQTAPYYYIDNAQPKLSYGRAAYDARHAYKFNVIYELPFLKGQKSLVSKALGGWTVSSFFQLYSGHPVDVHTGLGAIRAKSFTPIGGIEPSGATCIADPKTNVKVNKVPGCAVLVLDQNGVPYNVGGDYNMDGLATNDHPDFIGSSLGSVYSGASPADGIFKDNNRIGCGAAGIPADVNFAASSSSCTSTPSTLFANPAYPTGATPFDRFGTLGRDVFHGPRFLEMDASISKNFQVTERISLKFSAQFQNLTNHPSFDCITTALNSSHFGKAQCLAQKGAGGQSLSGLGLPIARVGSLGLRLSF